MKKTIFASGQNNHFFMLLSSTAHCSMKGIVHKPFFQFLCAVMVSIALLVAPGKAHGQCDGAIPCVSNIADYQCIGSSNVGTLMGTKLLPYPGTAETMPQKIIVGISLTVDVAYRFAAGSEIIMLPGSIIQVMDDFGTLGNVKIKGCGGSWLGIEVFSTGSITLVDSEISDACTAIDLPPGSKARITGNNFINNFRCIHAEGPITLFGEGIAHNNFEIISPPSGCGPNSKAILLVGIPFITIGNQDQTGIPNTIKNYTNGIDAKNSNFDLYNTVFRDKPTGVAIDMKAGGGTYKANIFGLGNSASSVALTDNYGEGIFSSNYDLTVRNALFKNGTQFINVSKDAASIVLPVSIDVKDNRFELFRAGAISCFAAKFQSATIKNNIILDNLDDFMAGQTRIGIKWANNTMVGFNKAQIQDNTVHDNLKTQPVGISELWQHYGISVNGSSNTKIESNLLSQNYQISEDRIYEGIRLFVSPFNDVVNNHVLSTGPSQGPFAEFSNFKGILSRESGNTLISCNVVDGLNHGLSFFGPTCDKTQLKSNIVKSNNMMGLYLASGSIIGQQPKRHNAWPGNGNTEALFDGDPAQGALLASQFILSTSNMNSAVWPNPRFPAVGWFVAPQAETPIPPYDLCYRDPSPPRSEADRQAINGEFQAYKGYPASLWEVQLSAFGTLAAHLELLTTGSADLQFYNAHDASNLGKLSRAIKVWESIAQFGTSLESTWNINQTSTNQKLEEIREKAIEMSQAQTLTQQEQIALEIASLESTLLALQETNQALSAQYQSGVNTNATQLLGSLVNITPTEI